jgi:hypothetical protein
MVVIGTQMLLINEGHIRKDSDNSKIRLIILSSLKIIYLKSDAGKLTFIFLKSVPSKFIE